MATEEVFVGTWKIVECVSLAGTVESTGIEGTEFILDEGGDVSWKVSDDVEPLPFFNCEFYDLVPEGKCSGQREIKFIGAYAGVEVSFKAEISDDLMLLTYERCCILQCQKISAPDPRDDVPYTCLDALEQGFFHDLVIKGQSGKEFKVHTSILCLTTPSIDWSKSPTPLTGLPDDVLQTTLHYIYAECLPRGLTEETVQKCVKFAHKIPELANFVMLCNTFLQNTALKQQIMSLVGDMHASADRIIETFRGMAVEDAPSSHGESSIADNPAKLCYVVKQCLREAAVAFSKLLVLCDLFTRRKSELSREERHDIIKYAKSRIPVFLKQWDNFLEESKNQLCALNPQQRHDVATYLVPEIEAALELFTTYIQDSKAALEQVISKSESKKVDKIDKVKKGNVGAVLGKALKNALHLRELKRLKKLNDRSTTSFFYFMERKDNFSTSSQAEKVRTVVKLFDYLNDVGQLSHSKVSELIEDMDSKIPWKDWKCLFKFSTSKVSWAICKMLGYNHVAEPLVRQASELVHRDEFNASLTSLGLLATASEQTDQSQPSSSAKGALPKQSNQPKKTKYVQLSSVESLCMSPHARDSRTAQNALKLFHSQKHADLTFEIILTEDLGDTVIDHTVEGEPVERTDADRDVEIHRIPAHRVIIAARCDWFRRALLSGMKESIDRKITIHDTSPELFRQFLEYIYSGNIEMNEMSTEHIAEMMTLADRYHTVCLRSRCEHALKHHLDETTVLYLLSLADQLSAKTLKDSCIQYVSENPVLTSSEDFADLPEHLQMEVEAVTLSSLECGGGSPEVHSSTDTPSSISSVSEMEEMADRMNIDSGGTSSSSEETLQTLDSIRLQECMESLREILGDGVPQDELVRVSLAADCDLNRAINFFYA